jgi:hypothetical protein
MLGKVSTLTGVATACVGSGRGHVRTDRDGTCRHDMETASTLALRNEAMHVTRSLLRSLGACLFLRIEIAWIDMQLLANWLERHWVRALQWLVRLRDGQD